MNEYRIVPPDGGVRWIRALGEIERDADGRALRMVGAHLAITDLKRAQSAAAEPISRWATVFIDADRARIVQVLENLLGNASKHSDEGGEIRVRLDVAGGAVEIVVGDDGAGIPAGARFAVRLPLA